MMICALINDRLRRVWAILIGMTGPPLALEEVHGGGLGLDAIRGRLRRLGQDRECSLPLDLDEPNLISRNLAAWTF